MIRRDKGEPKAMQEKLQEWKQQKKLTGRSLEVKKKSVNQKETALTERKNALKDRKQTIKSQNIKKRSKVSKEPSHSNRKVDSTTVLQEMCSENKEPTEQLTIREKLERWREEKGKNKPDTVNPLLSRKRALVTDDKKPKSAKKRKSNVKGLSQAKDKTKAHNSDPAKPKSSSENCEEPEIQKFGDLRKEESVTSQGEGETLAEIVGAEQSKGFQSILEDLQSEDAEVLKNRFENVQNSEKDEEVQNKEEELREHLEDKTACMTTLMGKIIKEADIQDAVNPQQRPFQVTARASTPEQDDLVTGKEDSNIPGKDLSHRNISPIFETDEAKNGIVLNADMNIIHKAEKKEERISTFSHFSASRRTATPHQSTKVSRQSGRRSLGPKMATKETDNRRKTMCLTPAQSSVPWNQDKAVKKNVLRSAPPKSFPSKNPHVTDEQVSLSKNRLLNSRTMNLAPNSVLREKPKRGRSVAFGEKIQSEKRSNARMSVDSFSKSNTTYGTPFRNRISSLPPTSILKSAPTRPIMSSQKKTQGSRKSIGTKASRVQQSSLTPFSSRIANLPPTSILKSAPSRRSVATIASLKEHQAKLNNTMTPKEPASNRKRRNTIHFARDIDAITPAALAPFTPRGEWQNKDLSVRERLDIWLTAKGNTVKKPFVVLQKTPHPKKKSLMATTPEDRQLNTTFTFEMSDDEDAESDEVSRIKKRIPMMNEIEASVIEESLRNMIDRVEQSSEVDAIKDELDLILSTSPGVVRLASFWIVRARLAAINGSVDRVICLLEQANAFDAQPQSDIRDEICKYLEKLKDEEIECGTICNENYDAFEPETPNADVCETTSPMRPTTTPAKRVKFAESQQHMIFKSSLIKFCLLECTPFRRKLKSSLARQVLTPVRRSGRIDKVESRLPSVVRSHVPTVSSPRDFDTNIQDGNVYFLPNPNVDSKWNEIWGNEKIDENEDNQLDVSY